MTQWLGLERCQSLPRDARSLGIAQLQTATALEVVVMVAAMAAAAVAAAAVVVAMAVAVVGLTDGTVAPFS